MKEKKSSFIKQQIFIIVLLYLPPRIYYILYIFPTMSNKSCNLKDPGEFGIRETKRERGSFFSYFSAPIR